MTKFVFFISTVVVCCLQGATLLGLEEEEIFSSQDEVKEKMCNDLNIIKHFFEIEYAPALWKESYHNWNLDDAIHHAKMSLVEKEGITIKDYHRVIRSFFNSMKDYHVGVSFFSTEMALLPFRIQSVDGHSYITWIHEAVKSSLPFKVGDEVLRFDGKPVKEVLAELCENECRKPDTATDQGLADVLLTKRLGLMGYVVPKGTVDITIRYKKSQKIKTRTLQWYYVPEEIKSPIVQSLFTAYSSDLLYKSPTSLKSTAFMRKMETPFYKQFLQAEEKQSFLFQMASSEEEDKFLGARKSFIPPLGPILWQTDSLNPFQAYLFETRKGKRVGFLRIPHFQGTEEMVYELLKIINYFEENSEALIIDQTNNPGGYDVYMYAIASMLTDHPLRVPSERLTITQEDVFLALDELKKLDALESDEDAQAVFGKTILGFPVDLEMARSYVQYLKFLVSEWKLGHTLTEPCYTNGIQSVNPHPQVQYSKPILLVINSLDFSAGDFFPAIMQDNHRATLIGTQTAGAGGFVIEEQYPNLFGVAALHLTGSIAKRTVEDKPIEDLGVSPDLNLKVTGNDLQNGYQDYSKAILEAVENL